MNTTLLLERVLPNSQEAEMSVIGSMLIDPGYTALTVAGRMRSDQFYYAAHQILFKEILKLINESGTCDQVLIGSRLRARGLLEEVGGMKYLLDLTEHVPTVSNVEHYVGIVEQMAMRRQGINLAHELMAGCFDKQDLEPGPMLLGTAQKLCNATKLDKEGAMSAKDAMPAVEANIERDYNTVGVVRGASTGFEDLDNVTHGMRDGDLIVLAGYRAKGKTSLAANIAANYCHRGDGVFIASLEQTRDELLWRMVFTEAGIDPSTHRAPSDKAKVLDAQRAVANWPLFIDGRRGRTAQDIASEAKRVHMRTPLRLIIVDYLQRMKWPTDAKGMNQAVALGLNTKALADLAGEIGCPLIVLSQFNRDNLTEGERPELHNLRGSGEIEEDAYQAWLLSDELDPDAAIDNRILSRTKFAKWSKDELKTLTLLYVAKNKNGPCGNVLLNFTKPLFRFDDSKTLLTKIDAEDLPGIRKQR